MMNRRWSMEVSVETNRKITGLTIVVLIENLKETHQLKELLAKNYQVQYIFITKNFEDYTITISEISNSEHIALLLEEIKLIEAVNLVLPLIQTNYLLVMDITDELMMDNEFSLNEQGAVMIPKRYKNSQNDEFFNSGFETRQKEIFIEGKESSDDSVESFILPFAHEIEIELEDGTSIENLSESSHYPDDLLWRRLFKFTGILWPTSLFSTVKKEGSPKIEAAMISIGLLLKNKTDFVFDQTIHFFESREKVVAIERLSKDDQLSLLHYIDVNIGECHEEKNIFTLQSLADTALLCFKNAIERKEVTLSKVRSDLQNIKNMSLSMLNKGEAEELVIAYCFPPYNDTSGNVMAKRINAEQKTVDVIYNKMDRIRKKDASLTKIAEEFIDTSFEMNAPQAFSSWESIEKFTVQGLEVFEQFKGKYKRLYSRAMFPASHFLAFEIKTAQKDIFWRAEFSDPLHTDVSSQTRYSPIVNESYIQQLYERVPEEYHHWLDDNIFNICEILPFIFADELIFTNHLQLEYMLKRFDDRIRKRVKSKSIIAQHPTLSEKYYETKPSYYKVDNHKLNLAYFGNFYSTRGFREIELICKYFLEDGIDNFVIHIFTNLNSQVISIYEQSPFINYIKMNAYVEYFEFLNLTNKMDVLIIMDAHTKGLKECNPYLPSKLSDYKGSKSNTLALIEERSILSEQEYENLFKVDISKFSKYGEIMKLIAGKVGKNYQQGTTNHAED